MSDRPQFVVSCLHMGDGGPRDNFAHMANGNREREFRQFLHHVDSQYGELTIIGDLFELWQGNVSRVLTCRLDLLDRLAWMGARYLIGNHDIDLLHLQHANGLALDHPLFRRIATQATLDIGGKYVRLIHGHEQDPYCRDEKPGIGRISAIYTGMKEDRNGGPLLGKYGTATVEARTLGRIGRIGSMFRRLSGQPSATQVMCGNVVRAFERSGCDALIFGHTHEPGQLCRFLRAIGHKIMMPIYNCGSWAEQTCSFVRIDTDGSICVMNWTDGKPVHNLTQLEVN